MKEHFCISFGNPKILEKNRIVAQVQYKSSIFGYQFRSHVIWTFIKNHKSQNCLPWRALQSEQLWNLFEPREEKLKKEPCLGKGRHLQESHRWPLSLGWTEIDAIHTDNISICHVHYNQRYNELVYFVNGRQCRWWWKRSLGTKVLIWSSGLLEIRIFMDHVQIQ